MKNIFAVLLILTSTTIYPMDTVHKKQKSHRNITLVDKPTDVTNDNDTITCNPRVRRLIVNAIRRYITRNYTNL